MTALAVTSAGADLRTRDVAALLGYSERHVRTLADQGVLPSFRLTPRSQRRFREDEIRELLGRTPEENAA